MKVIVIGAGEVGTNIARHLVQEEQDVVIIDNNPEKLAQISEILDVQTVEGFGSHPDVLEQAGCEDATMVVSVTYSDEVNMVACQMAYSLFNVPMKIARVRDTAYLEVTRNRLYTREHMPVDVIISPEVEVANAIVRTMSVPGAFDAEFFGDGRVAMVGATVTSKSPILNMPLREVIAQAEAPFVVTGIFRKDRLIVPHGEDHLEENDEVFFICARQDAEDSMQLLGHEEPSAHKVFIIGGGNIGLHVAERLEDMGLSARVLDRSSDRANELADLLNDSTILQGDALNKDVLLEENIAAMDMVVAVTDDDATNILASTLAHQLGADNVITLINHSNFISMVKSLGLEAIISPREITASRILQYVRRGRIISLHTIKDGRAEVMEAVATKDSPIVGVHVRDMQLPKNVIIGAVASGSEIIIPRGDTIIHAGDRVIMFCDFDHIHEVENLF